MSSEAAIHNLFFEEALFVYFSNKTMREQLATYLPTRGMDEGYLVTFDFSKTAETRRKHLDDVPQWMEWNGKRIFEVIV